MTKKGAPARDDRGEHRLGLAKGAARAGKRGWRRMTRGAPARDDRGGSAGPGWHGTVGAPRFSVLGRLAGTNVLTTGEKPGKLTPLSPCEGVVSARRSGVASQHAGPVLAGLACFQSRDSWALCGSCRPPAPGVSLFLCETGTPGRGRPGLFAPRNRGHTGRPGRIQ